MSDELELVAHGASGMSGAGVALAVQMIWQRLQRGEEQDVSRRLELLEKGQREILEKLAVLADREQRVIDDRRELIQLRTDREVMSVRLATVEARLQVLLPPPPPRESRP